MNLDKLKKIMKLTTSPVDTEATAAIRAANAMLAEHDTSWDEILQFKEDRLMLRAKRRGPEVESMLTFLDKHIRPSSVYRSFLDPVMAYYKSTGFVTGTQFDEIKRAFDLAQPVKPA